MTMSVTWISKSTTAILTLLCLLGCSKSPAPYTSQAVVTPAAVAGQYTVRFIIRDFTSDPKNPAILSSPTLTILAGSKGEIVIGEEKRIVSDVSLTWNGIRCTAVVNETGDGPKAHLKTAVIKKGLIAWSDSQIITVTP